MRSGEAISAQSDLMAIPHVAQSCAEKTSAPEFFILSRTSRYRMCRFEHPCGRSQSSVQGVTRE